MTRTNDMGDLYWTTPGGPEGHYVRVWLYGRLVCATSSMDRLAFALGSIRLEVGR